MSVHNEHTHLDGYNPAQLLHDGCDECEHRGENVELAIGNLDSERFVLAWERAAELQRHGLRNGSHAELPMLRTLAAVQVKLERHGWPIGVLPTVGERQPRERSVLCQRCTTRTTFNLDAVCDTCAAKSSTV